MDNQTLIAKIIRTILHETESVDDCRLLSLFLQQLVGVECDVYCDFIRAVQDLKKDE